jgi:hypothetical protein
MKATAESGKKELAMLRTQVFDLSADMKGLVERMLGQGVSFEDVAAALNQRGYAGISVDAVEVFFRANPRVQRERIHFQLATAQALKQALLDPESEQGELADAALFTGLVDLARRGVRFDLPGLEQQAAPNGTKAAELSARRAPKQEQRAAAR